MVAIGLFQVCESLGWFLQKVTNICTEHQPNFDDLISAKLVSLNHCVMVDDPSTADRFNKYATFMRRQRKARANGGGWDEIRNSFDMLSLLASFL